MKDFFRLQISRAPGSTVVPSHGSQQTWPKIIKSVVAAGLLGDLYVVERCTCGCRSVVFEEPLLVQNPKVSHRQDLVGEIDVHIRFGVDTDPYVSILLHHSWGKLTYSGHDLDRHEIQARWLNPSAHRFKTIAGCMPALGYLASGGVAGAKTQHFEFHANSSPEMDHV